MKTVRNRKIIFMTGATGFLGGHIARKLVANGHYLFCLRRPTTNVQKLKDIEAKINWVQGPPENFFRQNNVDSIIHCATNYGRDQTATETIDTNLILPLKLLRSATENQVKFFFNFDTVLDKRVNDYSLSKKQFLEWANNYDHLINIVNIKLHHFYGPMDNPSKFTAHIIKSLQDNVERLKLTSGTQKRDFIFIDDVVEAALKIFNYQFHTDGTIKEFEIGSGQTVSIREFVEKAKLIAGNTVTQLDFGSLPNRENEIYDPLSNTSELEKLGWNPKISLSCGLKRCFNVEEVETCAA